MTAPKFGHFQFQNRPLEIKTGQYPFSGAVLIRGIMHLTYHPDSDPPVAVSTANAGEAGAPAIKPSHTEREAMEDAFRDWLGSHWHTIEDGGTGDVAQLLLALKAASPNFCDSTD